MRKMPRPCLLAVTSGAIGMRNLEIILLHVMAIEIPLELHPNG